MADDYKPLRVPVALIQQRIFATSHRLEPWQGMVDSELKPWEPQKHIWRGKLFDAAGGLISYEDDDDRLPLYPVNGVIIPEYSIMKNLFDKIPHMRKYYALLDGVQRTKCRKCGGISTCNSERSEHVSCYHTINCVIRALQLVGMCVICEAPIIKTDVIIEYNDIPVCSRECLVTWDRMCPDSFEFALEKLGE